MNIIKWLIIMLFASPFNIVIAVKFITCRQEHIKPAKPVRKHVTTKYGEIQHGCLILILVTSKYGKAAKCACIPTFIGSPYTVQE